MSVVSALLAVSLLGSSGSAEQKLSGLYVHPQGFIFAGDKGIDGSSAVAMMSGHFILWFRELREVPDGRLFGQYTAHRGLIGATPWRLDQSVGSHREKHQHPADRRSNESRGEGWFRPEGSYLHAEVRTSTGRVLTNHRYRHLPDQGPWFTGTWVGGGAKFSIAQKKLALDGTVEYGGRTYTARGSASGIQASLELVTPDRGQTAMNWTLTWAPTASECARMLTTGQATSSRLMLYRIQRDRGVPEAIELTRSQER